MLEKKSLPALDWEFAAISCLLAWSYSNQSLDDWNASISVLRYLQDNQGIQIGPAEQDQEVHKLACWTSLNQLGVSCYNG